GMVSERDIVVRGVASGAGDEALAADVMNADVQPLTADVPVHDAIEAMGRAQVHHLPVVDEDDHLVGVVSLVDLVDPDRPHTGPDGYPMFYQVIEGERREIGEDMHLSQGQVADIMSPFVLSIDANASLVEAATLMLSEGVHRLLVMDGRRLVGIVTATDLLRGFIRSLR
ncbi:MAG TPA: CBS domain-containing protein, partial [Kofleriaceae bacterium]|nr:CBS domain-containing protein [Kofleriaceae bacterium]